VIAFCDNNPLLSGEKLDGIEIISPSELKSYRDCLIIISSVYSKEIALQLLELGIKDSYQIRFGVAEKTMKPTDFKNKVYSSEESESGNYGWNRKETGVFSGKAWIGRIGVPLSIYEIDRKVL
jgi:hypothetical protein